MKKGLLIAITLTLMGAVFTVTSVASIGAQNYKDKDLVLSGDFGQMKVEEDYIRIYCNFFDVVQDPIRGIGSAVEASSILDMIKNFIEVNPRSRLVDEAKLRAAEICDLMDRMDEAKKWLDDIIKNHPNASYTAVDQIQEKLVYTNEKTAAWALFYRARRFKECKDADLKTLFTEYKSSERPVQSARRL